MSHQMPQINLEALSATPEEMAIISKVLNKNKIRASKPVVKKDDPTTGEAYYVWRNVVFIVSQNPTHQCMPVMADFDIQIKDYKERRIRCKELDVLVDKIVNLVPKDQWHGISRWGRALGYGG